MLVELLATLNGVASIIVAVLTFHYSSVREHSWDRPWPPVEDREAYSREEKYRVGLDARRMIGLMASLFVCCPLALYLCGTMWLEWSHEWWRLAAALTSLAAMFAVLVRTGVHNGLEEDRWNRRYRRW